MSEAVEAMTHILRRRRQRGSPADSDEPLQAKLAISVRCGEGFAEILPEEDPRAIPRCQDQLGLRITIARKAQ